MDFQLTDEQLDIQPAARELARSFSDEYWAARDGQNEFPWEFYNVFEQGGWLGIAIPEDYGGGGMGIFEASLLLEEIGASGVGMNGCSPPCI